MSERVVVLGEVLWDVFASGERIGGAAFNFATQLLRLGHQPLLVTAVGEDERGERTLDAMETLGLNTRMVKSIPGADTGSVTVTVDENGQPDYILHRPAAWDVIELPPGDLSLLHAFDPAWIYFGTLQNCYPISGASNRRVLDSLPSAQRIYDLNLRKDSFRNELVWDLMGRAGTIKLNGDEVEWASKTFDIGAGTLDQFASELSRRTGCHTILMTLGEHGSAMYQGGVLTRAEGYSVTLADTVGAGDAFTAAALNGMSRGWEPAQILDFANRLGAWVASRPGGIPEWSLADLQALAH